MDDTLRAARETTAAYHRMYYANHELYKPGSWLAFPAALVESLAERLDSYSRVLDLGCGVGRNAIALARSSDAMVTCVDILPDAISRLEEYAVQNGVGTRISGVLSPMEDFAIEPNAFDLILAVSCIEHVDSKEMAFTILESIKQGIKPGGAAYITFSTERTVCDATTKTPIDSPVETRWTSEEALRALMRIFHGWHFEELSSCDYSETFDLNNRIVHWQSKEVVCLARNY